METTQNTETVDVVVVGARCAGATTAMLLERFGHDVVTNGVPVTIEVQTR